MAMAQNPGTLANAKAGGRWMFIPQEMVHVGWDMGDVGWSRLFSALVQAPHETSWPLCVICVYGNDKVCKRMCIYIYVCIYICVYICVCIYIYIREWSWM